MNKNLMKMDGMKRAVKITMKGGGDLGSVTVDQKSSQEIIKKKLIPSINNVAMSLLKWSYTESNYTFPDVFSAWADLDAGFTQLLQEYLNECTRYRKSFKDIINEAKKVTEAQKEKEKTASKVSAVSGKLEAARKAAAKKHDNNEKTRANLNNLEAELRQAKAKDDEADDFLFNTVEEFESYKASMLKDSLITHCQSLQDLLQKGSELCQVKLEIAESMPDDPAVTPDPGDENNQRVEAIFNKYHLQLQPRDPTLERNLPIQRFKTLPPPASHIPPKSPMISKQISLPGLKLHGKYPKPAGGMSQHASVMNRSSDFDSEEGEDEDDYMVPTEDIVKRKSVKSTPPELPPRNVVAEEDYVVPTLLSPNSPMANRQRFPSSPRETGADYFQVTSDEENDGKPRRPTRKTSGPGEKNIPDPEDEEIYVIPPDEDEDDSGQIYGNMTNQEREEQKRVSASIPAKPLPFTKPRKPAVYPKPGQKSTKEAPSWCRQSSASKDEECPVTDNDIYSAVYEQKNNNDESGLLQSHTFVDSDDAGHDRQTKHTYFLHEKHTTHIPHQENDNPVGETDSTDVAHTYFNVRIEDQEMHGSSPHVYTNVAIPDQTGSTSNSNSTSPVAKKPPPSPIAKKPTVPSRKPLVPARGGVK